MIVAVAYNNGEIGEHFGHAEMFALYDYYGSDVSECNKRLIDSSGCHGHQAMAELMRDNKVDAVLSGHMGPEAKRTLLSFGIVPISGSGCGGCSGCGHDEGEDCACGGGCSGCH